jgi:hypothetical protein
MEGNGDQSFGEVSEVLGEMPGLPEREKVRATNPAVPQSPAGSRAAA